MNSTESVIYISFNQDFVAWYHTRLVDVTLSFSGNTLGLHLAKIMDNMHSIVYWILKFCVYHQHGLYVNGTEIMELIWLISLLASG